MPNRGRPEDQHERSKTAQQHHRLALSPQPLTSLPPNNVAFHAYIISALCMHYTSLYRCIYLRNMYVRVDIQKNRETVKHYSAN